MKIYDIENKIACNELSAAQVYTQMKQHIDTSIERDRLVNELIDAIRGRAIHWEFKAVLIKLKALEGE